MDYRSKSFFVLLLLIILLQCFCSKELHSIERAPSFPTISFKQQLQRLHPSTNTVYTSLIYHLHGQLKDVGSKDREILTTLINEVKILFLNHSQKRQRLLFLIDEALDSSLQNSRLRAFLEDVRDEIPNLDQFNRKEQWTFEDHRNPYARMFESLLGLQLIEKPLPAVLDAVSAVSVPVWELIEGNWGMEEQREDFLNAISVGPSHYGEGPCPLAFGRFVKKPSKEDIRAILLESDDLVKQILVHTLFIEYWYREIPEIKAREAASSSLAQMAASLLQSFEGRLRFINNHFQDTHFFRQRGRLRVVKETPFTYTTGLTLDGTSAFLPKRESSWQPDSISTIPDFSNYFVVNALSCGIPYVSGPSGMTNELMGASELIGVFSDISQKRNYLIGILGYITGGGLHSAHEVLLVADEYVNLLEGKYRIIGEDSGNYHDVFEILADNNGFEDSLRLTWEAYLTYFHEEVCSEQERYVYFSAFQKKVNSKQAVDSVILVSSDGKRFFLDELSASKSSLLRKKMNKSGIVTVEVPRVSGSALTHVVDFLRGDIDRIDHLHLSEDETIRVLMAANYLNI